MPKALVDSEAHALRERTLANLREQPNVKPENLELSLDMFRPQAEERVALGLIIAELVRNEQLHAKPEQIKALVDGDRADVRAAGGGRALALREAGAAARIRGDGARAERRRLDLARAKVTDEPTTFEAIMGSAPALTTRPVVIRSGVAAQSKAVHGRRLTTGPGPILA